MDDAVYPQERPVAV